MSSCVGYSTGFVCYLYPSDDNQKCPEGFNLDILGTVAATANDLVDAKVGVPYGSYCKAKQGIRQENY